MVKYLNQFGQLPYFLIFTPVLILFFYNLISFLYNCTYEDAPNIWICSESAGESMMYFLDPILLFTAPLFFIGLLLAIFRIVTR